MMLLLDIKCTLAWPMAVQGGGLVPCSSPLRWLFPGDCQQPEQGLADTPSWTVPETVMSRPCSFSFQKVQKDTLSLVLGECHLLTVF